MVVGISTMGHNYEIGEHIQIKNGAGTTPRHNNQENTENYY